MFPKPREQKSWSSRNLGVEALAGGSARNLGVEALAGGSALTMFNGVPTPTG